MFGCRMTTGFAGLNFYFTQALECFAIERYVKMIFS